MTTNAPNSGAPSFTDRVLRDFKTQIYPNPVIVGDSNTPLFPTDKSTGQKLKRNP